MTQANRREYLRASVMLQARCQILCREEIELFLKGMGSSLLSRGSFSSPMDEFLIENAPQLKEEPIFHCLHMLNNKLDFIIDQLCSTSVPQHTYGNKVIEISGSGLRFLSQESFPVGALIRVELILPDSLQFRIEFIGEVMRIERREEKDIFEDDGGVVAARYAQIDEESRDAIIKTVFKRQRQLIRMERTGREG